MEERIMYTQENGAVSGAGNGTANTAANAVANVAGEIIPFQFPDMGAGEFSQEELAEDMAGMQMSLQRVKIPGGGMLMFEMATDDPENPEYEKYLEGVIIHNHAACAYWPEGSEHDENAVPLCSSVDGKQGIGEPGGACEACFLNRFGSGKDGRGKLCKNMRHLYILRSGELMPIQLSLPPTSLSPFRDFLNRAFTLRRRATYGSVVRIGLKKMNNGKDDYSVATFQRLSDFSGEELAIIRDYANGFKTQIKATLEQRATANEGQRDNGCDYEDMEHLPAGAGGRFHGTPDTIDGDREKLPA
jgi:hypothetical protein